MVPQAPPANKAGSVLWISGPHMSSAQPYLELSRFRGLEPEAVKHLCMGQGSHVFGVGQVHTVLPVHL